MINKVKKPSRFDRLKIAWRRLHLPIHLSSSIATIIVLVITIRSVYLMEQQPIVQLRANLSEKVAEIRTRIVNLHEGCAGNPTYANLIDQENKSRIRLTDDLISLIDAQDLIKVLGKQSFSATTCLIKYNVYLDKRKRVCDGEIKNAKEMIRWEIEIRNAIYKKRNKTLECQYDA